MNWDIAKGQWKEFRGQVKEQWGKLTDDDLDQIEGKPISCSVPCKSATASLKTRPNGK